MAVAERFHTEPAASPARGQRNARRRIGTVDKDLLEALSKRTTHYDAKDLR